MYCLTLSTIIGFLPITAAAVAKSLQSRPTLSDPIDGSPPGSSVPGILQARTLEWVAISFSNAWKWKVKVKSLSRVWLLATPRTAAHQAPPSMWFSRREYWSGVPLPPLLPITRRAFLLNALLSEKKKIVEFQKSQITRKFLSLKLQCFVDRCIWGLIWNK